MAALAAHPWPGNVRELQNALANPSVTGPRYGAIGPAALPGAFRGGVASDRPPTLAEARKQLERAIVRDAMSRHQTVSRAASELGISRPGLMKLMARLCRSTGSIRAASGPRTGLPGNPHWAGASVLR